MPINIPNSHQSNFGNDWATSFDIASVAASAGNVIVAAYSTRVTGNQIAAAPTWNGEAFTLWHTSANESTRVNIYRLVCATSATAAIVCAPSDWSQGAGMAHVCSGDIATTDTFLTPVVSFEDGTSAPWVAPAGSISTAAADLVIGFLFAANQDSVGDNLSGGTFTQGSGQSSPVSIAHANNYIGNLLSSSKSGADGSTSVSWTLSQQPRYVHVVVGLKGLSGGVSINSYPATVRSGQTGISYATTGLSSVSGVAIGTLAATGISDTSGDGTHSIPALTDETVHEMYGTKTVTVSGTEGSQTVSVSFLPPAGNEFTELSGTLNTSETGALFNFSPAAVVTDQIVFPDAILISPQGNIQGPPGVYTLWHIKASTKVARSLQLTLAAPGDTTPDAFSFNTPSLAALGATVTSANATINGINAAAAVSVTGGLVSINGGAFVSSGTITNGQTIAAQVTASNSFSTAVTATVTIGGVSANFTATTIAADTTPDSFSFNAISGAITSSTQTSNTVTVAGLNTSAAVSVSGGTYSKNGGAYTSTAGTVVNGDTLTVRHTASASALTQVITTLTVGSFSAQFSSTTAEADTTPDLITFPASTNCAPGSAQASAVRSITGIDAAAQINGVTNCTYSVGGAAATAADGSVVNNQSIQLFAFASNTPGATVNASITIGGQVFTWAITTAQPQISLPTQGGAMSGDARLNVLQKLTSNILSALNAVGSSTVPVPVKADIKRGNYAYSSLGAPSISSKTANQVIYSNPFNPSGEAVAIQFSKFLTGNLIIGAGAFAFLECDLTGSTAYKPVHGTKRILVDGNYGAGADGSYVFNFVDLKGGNYRVGINCGAVSTPSDVPATGTLGFNVTVMN